MDSLMLLMKRELGRLSAQERNGLVIGSVVLVVWLIVAVVFQGEAVDSGGGYSHSQREYMASPEVVQPAKAERPAAALDAEPEFDLTMKTGNQGVYIRNDYKSALERVEVQINSGVFGSGFSAYVGDVAAGEELRLYYSEFAKKDGERFNLERYRVNQVAVVAWVGKECLVDIGTF